jgi:long-chain acyl-CoA synthetase
MTLPAKCAAQAPSVEHILSQLESSRGAEEVLVSSTTGSLTRSQLSERCSTLAGLIRSEGLRVVALHMDNRPDWAVIDLACQQASVCLVPLPGFFSEEQLRHVLNTVPVDALFTDRPELLAPLVAGRLRPGPALSVGECTLLRIEPAASPAVIPADTGKITFTSGSTGRPKGVCLSNRQLLDQAAALADAVGLRAPRHLCVLPLSTLLENIAGIYTPLLAGGEVMLPQLAEVGFEGSSSLNPHTFLTLLSRQQPHSVILTPQLLQLLVAAAQSGWTPPASLRFVAVGGAKVPGGLIDKAQDLGIPAFEGYGLSECASVVSLNVPGGSRSGSCGRPLPHLQVDIDDGEVRVRGNAMLGYAGEPESWGQEWIRTGDLGRLDEQGYLHINGRRKNLLISSYGRNINPEWVESELLADAELADCVVFGDARPYCVALLTPRDPAASDASIQRWVDLSNTRLPDYARIQRWHRLHEPLSASKGLLTENGRPKRQAILARYGQAIESLYRTRARARTA